MASATALRLSARGDALLPHIGAVSFGSTVFCPDLPALALSDLFRRVLARNNENDRTV